MSLPQNLSLPFDAPYWQVLMAADMYAALEHFQILSTNVNEFPPLGSSPGAASSHCSTPTLCHDNLYASSSDGAGSMTLEPFHYNWLNGTPTTSFDSNNTQPALNSIVDGLFMPFAGYPERSAHPSNFSFAEVAAVPFEALPSTEPPAPTGQFPADVLFFDTIGRKRVRYTLRDNTGDKLVGPTHEFDVHDIDHVDPTSLCNDESFFQEYKYYSNPYLDEDGNPRKRWPFERSVNNLLWNMILYNEELRGFGRRDLGRIVDTYRDLSGLTKRSQHKPPKDVRAHPYSNTKTKTRQARRTEASVGDFESFMSPTVSPLPHGRFTRR